MRETVNHGLVYKGFLKGLLIENAIQVIKYWKEETKNRTVFS